VHAPLRDEEFPLDHIDADSSAFDADDGGGGGSSADVETEGETLLRGRKREHAPLSKASTFSVSSVDDATVDREAVAGASELRLLFRSLWAPLLCVLWLNIMSTSGSSMVGSMPSSTGDRELPTYAIAARGLFDS
jgi:hypothetical protein